MNGNLSCFGLVIIIAMPLTYIYINKRYDLAVHKCCSIKIVYFSDLYFIMDTLVGVQNPSGVHCENI